MTDSDPLLAARRWAITAQAAKVATDASFEAALENLRALCRHTTVGAHDDAGHPGYRVCTECGTEDRGDYGTYSILKGKPLFTRSNVTDLRAECRFPTKVCAGSNILPRSEYKGELT